MILLCSVSLFDLLYNPLVRDVDTSLQRQRRPGAEHFLDPGVVGRAPTHTQRTIDVLDRDLLAGRLSSETSERGRSKIRESPNEYACTYSTITYNELS